MDETTSETLPAHHLDANAKLDRPRVTPADCQTSVDVLLARPLTASIKAARDQFRTDFPELLVHRTTHPNEKWVAYHGERRLGFGTTKIELVKICLDRGLAVGEFLVLGIDPAAVDHS